MDKVEYSSASISGKHCTDCGWPVVEVCCNGNFLDKISEDVWDWWVYCSNKSCVNHEGEGQFQNSIHWINQ